MERYQEIFCSSVATSWEIAAYQGAHSLDVIKYDLRSEGKIAKIHKVC